MKKIDKVIVVSLLIAVMGVIISVPGYFLWNLIIDKISYIETLTISITLMVLIVIIRLGIIKFNNRRK